MSPVASAIIALTCASFGMAAIASKHDGQRDLQGALWFVAAIVFLAQSITGIAA